MGNSNIDLFMKISEALTGCSLSFSLAKINGHIFYDLTTNRYNDIYTRIENLARETIPFSADHFTTALEKTDDISVKQLAQSISLLWYLGYDYAPEVLKGAATRGDIIPDVVSSQAYKGGLAWKVAGAEPMGFSTRSYGYWGDKPHE